MGIFGTITVKDFKATGYRTLTAEFESAVPEASKATIAVKRGNTTIFTSAKATWNQENTVATFKNDVALPAGDYTLSIKNSANEDITKPYTVEEEKVQDIVIDDTKDVLTGTSSASKQEGRSNDEAYIYYDVKNQYGESIRHRVTVNWSITSCDTNKEKSDRILGLVVAQRKNDREIFTYGTQLQVTGTCIKGESKISKSFNLKVGAIQTVDKVEIKGFVKEGYITGRNLKDKEITKDKISDKVDADFTKGTHSFLYQTFDQNGNVIEAANDNLGSGTENAKVVFRSSDPNIIQDVFRDGGVYTVRQEDSLDEPEYSKYSSATIDPGKCIDRGSNITFKYITTGTSGNGEQTFGIGEAKRLKSFKIEAPSGVVADGDSLVLDFTAIATDGSSVKDYKTIARSSNYLTFTASDGTLVLSEDDAGNAVLRWTDAAKYRHVIANNIVTYNPYNRNNGLVINDGVDRAISLTAVVEGENGTVPATTIMSVSDMRHPESVADVRHGTINDDMLIARNINSQLDIINDMEYIDQYGERLNAEQKRCFWEAAVGNNLSDCQYAIRIKPSSSSNPTDQSIVQNSTDIGVRIINYPSGNGRYAVYNGSYSVIRRDEASLGDNINMTAAGKWYELGKPRSETYTTVPLNMLSDFDISTRDNTGGNGLKLGIVTELSKNDNGSFNVQYNADGFNYGDYSPNAPVSPSAVTDNGSAGLPITTNLNDLNNIRVISRYKGVELGVPTEYYMATTDDGPWSPMVNGVREIVSGSSIMLNGAKNKIDAIKAGSLQWKDLYNVNDARYTRKDAELKLQLFVSEDVATGVTQTSEGTLLEKRIKISDQLPGISQINSPAETTIHPNNAVFTGADLNNIASVSDQYGQLFTLTGNNKLIYSISSYDENPNGRYSGNHEIVHNGTDDVTINNIELGDVYYVTVEVSNNIVPAKRIKVTAGADTWAHIDSNIGIVQTAEYHYRFNNLGYNR